MESPDLNPNSVSTEDRQLAAFLRQAAPPLADDGFSQRVLAALPAAPGVATRRAPSRWIMCSVGASVGLVVALAQGVTPSRLAAANANVHEALGNAAAAFRSINEPGQSSSLLLATLVVAASLIYALSNPMRRRLW